MLPGTVGGRGLTGSLHPTEAASPLPPSVPVASLTRRAVRTQQSRAGDVPARLLEAPDKGRCARGVQSPTPNRHGPQEPSDGRQGREQGAVGVGAAVESRQVVGRQEAVAVLLLQAVN